MRRHLTTPAILLCIVIGGSLVVATSNVWAGEGSGVGYGTVSDGTITATASSAGNATEGSTSGGADNQALPPACPYVPAPPNIAAYLGPGSTPQGGWYLPSCSLPVATSAAYPAVWIPSSPTNSQAPSVPALLQQAIGQAALVHPGIELNPPGQEVVNVPTWLWISPSDWSSVSANAAAGLVNATVTANPVAVIWTFGDGNSITCPGPGVPYNPALPSSQQSTYCSYTWRTSSAGQPNAVFVVTATIEYQVATVVTGAPDPSPNLGLHAGPSAQAEVPVSEVEALGTNP